MSKGAKLCGKCGEANGCRTLNCKKCGTSFNVVAGATKEEVGFIPTFGNLIVAPSGACPIKFAGEEAVEWAIALNDREAKQSGNKLGLSALTYWLRTFNLESDSFNYYSDQLREAFSKGIL